MYVHQLLAVLTWFLVVAPLRAQAQEEYPVHPDSQPQEGTPRGEIKGPFEWKSEIFPGTVRKYWIYVPQQYTQEKPACVMVVQDGLGHANGLKLPTVLDNLIHQGDVPVTIGIFVEPGVVPTLQENAQPRFNRSYEYDAMGDRYARFLIEEILPAVAKDYKLSDDPNDRAIAGASSGAIAAFTVAWERPDAFRRVFSSIGTYVGLRGGDAYPVLIRKTERKPIRVFLQDGSGDLNIYAGDWWTANLDMLSALQYAGYDVHHVWGEGGHNTKHAAAILPDALRWLWRDYPEPIATGQGGEQPRTDILIPDEGWRLVSEGHKFTEGPAANAQGEVFFTDIPNNRIHKVGLDGAVSVFVENSGGANGLMFGPDGRLYACRNRDQQIVRYDESGHAEVILTDAPCNDLVILLDGGYYTDPDNKKVWRFDFEGNRDVVDTGLEFANGVMTTADQAFLWVSDTRGRFVYSYQIQPDGALANKQTYGHLHLDDEAKGSGADGLTVDTEGRLYVTTKLGLQVLDQLGRVHLILPRPHTGWLSNVAFGGPEFDTLYITCGDKVYRRKMNARGVLPWQGPVQPPKPGL